MGRGSTGAPSAGIPGGLQPVATSTSENLGVLKCLRCRGQLAKSGKEPTRLVCEKCGQEYHAVLHLQPIDPKPESLPELDAGRGSGSG